MVSAYMSPTRYELALEAIVDLEYSHIKGRASHKIVSDGMSKSFGLGQLTKVIST